MSQITLNRSSEIPGITARSTRRAWHPQSHPRSRALTREDIQKAARAATLALAANQLKCCLVGSAACSMYGMSRVPNDVDMVVLTDAFGQEAVKQMIVNNDEDFFLVRAKTPGATYKILYYALTPWGAWCKVDILLPGTLNIPFVPTNLIARAWTDHRVAGRMDLREKQYVDITDIKELLGIIAESYPDQIINGQHWVPAGMIDAAQKRVDEFAQQRPETRNAWLSIGFKVHKRRK